MLNAIVRFSLRFRTMIIALSLLAVGYGIYVLSRSRFDVFPEFAPPLVVIQTEAPGLAPEQVEVLITQPVENAINGVGGIESLRSGSIQGLSVITVTFDPGTDIYRARQAITERLATVSSQLPQGAGSPVMTPLTSSISVVMAVGLTSSQRSLMELRTIADWTVKQRLLAVPGVSKVAVFGGEVKQLQVQLYPDRLIRYNLAIEDVLSAAANSTAVQGAGFIENGNQRIVLQTVGQSLRPEEIAASVVLHQNGANVSLSDVADVKEAPEPPIGGALISGKPGVLLVVSSQYGANTLEVTQRIDQAMSELLPALRSEGVEVAHVFRPANFIQTAIGNIKSSLILGAVLVVAVLVLFLFDFRTAAISCSAIPLSLLAAVVVLDYFGYSLNTMTLGGLAIAIGAVVDDAVIDVENILRRLRENQGKEKPDSPFRVVLAASLEVRSAIVYATFAVALVFLPVLTMSGLAGRLFAPLGFAYIAAILASLIVALTITPALCLLLLGTRELKAEDPPVIAWSKSVYRSLLAGVERSPRVVMVAAAIFTIAGLAVAPYFGAGFLPELREGHFIVHMSAVPGTSIPQTLRLNEAVTRELTRLPYVQLVASQVGRAEKADDIFGTHYTELHVDLKPLKGKEAESAPAEIRRVLARFPGINSAVKTFLTERVEETISGYTASVVVNIFGSDLNSLDAKAREVAAALSNVPGATEVQQQSPPGTPQIVIRLRKEDLQRWGFNSVEVQEATRIAYQGTNVAQVYDGNRVFDVSVILSPDLRNNISEIGKLPLRNSDGPNVTLGQLADIYPTSGRYVVLHEGARRVQTITCNVTGRDVNSFVADARKQIAARVSFPAGSYVEFGGAAEAQARSRQDLTVHSLIAAIAILLLLSVVMENSRNLILVLLNLPFALVGGVLAVFFTGGWLSVGSLVGFVTIFGITLRNSIMMISHYEHLVRYEGMEWGVVAAMRGASERLSPILMTALVTALGLLPLAIGSGDPGREIEGPMAIVILGGLATSTALNLLILPALALRYGRFEQQPLEGKALGS